MSAVCGDGEALPSLGFDRDGGFTRDRRDEEGHGPDLHVCHAPSVFGNSSATCRQPLIGKQNRCSIHGDRS